jgi:hypothetical protein
MRKSSPSRIIVDPMEKLGVIDSNIYMANLLSMLEHAFTMAYGLRCSIIEGSKPWIIP